VAKRVLQKRFVVLEHTPSDVFDRTGDVHFDWMFENEESLLTWATEPIDNLDPSICIAAQKLPDHRREYLDFEGDIGGNRGSVVRRFEGDYRLLDCENGVFVAELVLVSQRDRYDKREPHDDRSRKIRLEIRSGILRLL